MTTPDAASPATYPAAINLSSYDIGNVMSAIQNETLDGVFAVLRQHRCIGWDLDNTLLGHRASDKLHDFIRASPDIRHLLITFRTAQGTIWTDLASQQRAVSADSFSVVETMDPVLATNFMRLQRQRAQGLYAGPMAFCELEYRSWKGRVCARHGASLLIDDMTDYVSLGCERHAISLLHPDQLV